MKQSGIVWVDAELRVIRGVVREKVKQAGGPMKQVPASSASGTLGDLLTAGWRVLSASPSGTPHIDIVVLERD